MSELKYTARLDESDDSVIYSSEYGRHISAMTGEQLNSKSDIACELACRDIEIARLQQQLKQQWVSVDITDIKLDSIVKLRSGDTGVVFGIYDVIADGVNGGVAAARFFIRLDNNKGEQYHTHRKDGVSYAKARGDIIEIKPPAK